MRIRFLLVSVFVFSLSFVSLPNSAQAGVTGNSMLSFGDVWDCTDPRELLSGCLKPEKQKPKPQYNPSAYSLRVKAYQRRTKSYSVGMKKPSRSVRDKRVE